MKILVSTSSPAERLPKKFYKNFFSFFLEIYITHFKMLNYLFGINYPQFKNHCSISFLVTKHGATISRPTFDFIGLTVDLPANCYFFQKARRFGTHCFFNKKSSSFPLVGNFGKSSGKCLSIGIDKQLANFSQDKKN